MKLVHFENAYFEDLANFYIKMYPKKSLEYLKYRLYQFPESPEDNSKNLIVLNDENKIIGCNLFFPTKAKIMGSIEKVFWSHDTIVAKECRDAGDAGMLLISELMHTKNVFGAGLSDINLKIHRKIKASFIGEINKYLILSNWSFLSIFYKLQILKSTTVDYKYPETISVGTQIFSKISNIKDLSIPNNGFWNEGLDIDFIRDEHFLKKRFFENDKTYEFYKLKTKDIDECYFVVRKTIKNKIPVLQIVDLRYNLNNKIQFDLIMKAILKILNKNRIPFAFFRTNIITKKYHTSPLMYKLKGSSHFITYNRIRENVSFFITFADSDSDADFRNKQ